MSGDARSAGGGWALRTICVLGAAAMAAVGAYLFEPALLDLGLYVERGKYALLGAALIYAAALVALSATVGAIRIGGLLGTAALSFVIGAIALFALGVLFVALAIDALFVRDPANFWVGLLALAGAICFAAAGTADMAQHRAQLGAAEGQSERGVIATSALLAVYLMLGLVAALVYVNVGFLLFYVLQANLFEGADIDFERLTQVTGSVLYELLAQRGLVVFVLGIIGALFVAAIMTFAKAWERTSERKYRRALTPTEEAFVTRSADALRAYAEARGYAKQAKALLWPVVFPSLLAPALIAAIVGFNLHNWVPRPYALAEMETFGWHVYERTMGASAIVMLFAGILWGVLPNAVLSRIWRSYSEIVGWSGFAKGQASPEPYLQIAVSSGALSPTQTFDPGAFLHRLNTMFEPYFLYPAVLLSLVAALVWHHDMSRYHVLTDRYVEVMTYWTLERRRFTYSTVRGVELACRIDDGRPVASYEILLPDGFSVDLFDKKSFADHVGDLARVDALVPAGVPRTFAAREGQSAYDPICVEVLAATLPEADVGRLRTVMRTEVWYKARWRERIGATK